MKPETEQQEPESSLQLGLQARPESMPVLRGHSGVGWKMPAPRNLRCSRSCSRPPRRSPTQLSTRSSRPLTWSRSRDDHESHRRRLGPRLRPVAGRVVQGRRRARPGDHGRVDGLGCCRTIRGRHDRDHAAAARKPLTPSTLARSPWFPTRPRSCAEHAARRRPARSVRTGPQSERSWFPCWPSPGPGSLPRSPSRSTFPWRDCLSSPSSSPEPDSG